MARYFQPGDHGTTFGGNPLAATVALEVLDWLQSEGLEHVRQMAPKMEAKLVALQDAFPEIVSGYRGRGLMWGLVVKVPAKTLVLDALDNGLILNAPKPDVIRMLPPLIIDDRALDAFFEIMTQVFSSYITSQREGA